MILGAFFALGACKAGYLILKTQDEYHSGETTYEQLQDLVSKPSSDPKTKQLSQSDEIKTDSEKYISGVDFTALQNINSDIVGWLRIEGCEIDYPLVQGTDNGYYLKHLFNRAYNNSGCLFLDYRNAVSFSDSNNVVFGHHMKNGTMFSSLMKYKDQSFYDEYPSFYLFTPQTDYTVEIFAGYVANLQDDAWKIEFEDKNEFGEWLNERINSSMIRCDIQPTTEDTILTLSTCSYEFNNARFVLFGVLRQGIQ